MLLCTEGIKYIVQLLLHKGMASVKFTKKVREKEGKKETEACKGMNQLKDAEFTVLITFPRFNGHSITNVLNMWLAHTICNYANSTSQKTLLKLQRLYLPIMVLRGIILTFYCKQNDKFFNLSSSVKYSNHCGLEG